MEQVIICKLDATDALSAYRKLTGKLNQFIAFFEEIMKAKFDENAYEPIINRDFDAYNQKFIDTLEKDLKPIPSRFRENFRSEAMRDIDRLKKSFEELHRYKESLERPSMSGRGFVTLFWKEISIVNGRGAFGEVEAKNIEDKYFTVRVDSEEKRNLLAKADAFYNAWKALVETLFPGQKKFYGYAPAGLRFNRLNPEENILFDGIFEVDESGDLKTRWEEYFTAPAMYIPDPKS